MSLSNAKLKSLLNKPQEKRFELSDRDGLSVRVSITGTLTFQYRFRFKGKAKRLSLGQYPGVTLSQCRQKIPEIKQYLQEGKDPIAELKRKRFDNKIMIDDCIKAFMERHVVRLSPKTQYLYKYTFNKHVLGKCEIPAEEITMSEWFEFFDRIEDQHSSITARDMLVRMKTCMRFAIKRGIIESTPLLSIATKDIGSNSAIGERVVSPEEIRTVWRELDKSKCYPTTANSIKLASLTGARLGEIRHMKKDHLDLKNKIWTVPKEISKTRKTIVRPIAPEAFKIIKWQLDTFGEITDYVFPSGSYKKQISPQTINKLSRHVVARAKMAPWSSHDFRRSLSTILSSKGVELHVSEKMLGHNLGGILAVYNKHHWIEEQRAAYE
ncbi:tyrosine-type recombinase/integrase [Thalassotalea crassostreae]|uniref:tyrosine-type recombinase/integrase n=1 Tax=Thalassotalea crassostreae TaxID=1763536 RepID=UPI000837B246|nr:site-specific integrase [Thalassotalea crassostreae]